MKTTLDISKILKTACSTLQAKWKILLPMVFFAWLFSILASFGVDSSGPLGVRLGPDVIYPLYFLFGVLTYTFLSLLVSIGLMYIFIQTVDEKKTTRGDMLEGFTFKKMFSFIGAYILYSLVVIIGLILFVVPGIYIAVALIPLFYVIVDKNVGPFVACKTAYAMTKGHWWHILGITILAGLITLAVFVVFAVFAFMLFWLASLASSVGVVIALALGVPAFIVLVLLTQTYVALVHAHMYKELRDHMNKS